MSVPVVLDLVIDLEAVEVAARLAEIAQGREARVAARATAALWTLVALSLLRRRRQNRALTIMKRAIVWM